MPTVSRGTRANVPLLKHRMAQADLDIGGLAERAKLHRWAVSRAVNGHPISSRTLRKIAEALAAAPIVDGGLLAKPTQLEEG